MKFQLLSMSATQWLEQIINDELQQKNIVRSKAFLNIETGMLTQPESMHNKSVISALSQTSIFSPKIKFEHFSYHL